MSEALTFQLVKNKILNIEAYEVWAYSIEIILLNGSILLGCRRKHGRYLYKMLHTVILWHHSDFRRNSVGRRSFKKSEDF